MPITAQIAHSALTPYGMKCKNVCASKSQHNQKSSYHRRGRRHHAGGGRWTRSAASWEEGFVAARGQPMEGPQLQSIQRAARTCNYHHGCRRYQYHFGSMLSSYSCPRLCCRLGLSQPNLKNPHHGSRRYCNETSTKYWMTTIESTVAISTFTYFNSELSSEVRISMKPRVCCKILLASLDNSRDVITATNGQGIR